MLDREETSADPVNPAPRDGETISVAEHYMSASRSELTENSSVRTHHTGHKYFLHNHTKDEGGDED